MEHAKEYKTNENIRLATMYIKENCKWVLKQLHFRKL
jgi:hypothetical protein